MISENIKNARNAKGISQQELALKLNVVRQTISKWEMGLSVPDADLLIRLADLLDVTIDDLLDVEPHARSAADFSNELAQLREQLADKNQEQALCRQAGKRRGAILLLSFLSMLLSIHLKNELLSLALIGCCLLAALIILYRSLALLSRVTTFELKIGTLKITTVFSITVLLLTIVAIALDKTAIARISETDEELLAFVITSAVILFAGFISPKLPFNRHTGLRLPWTLQDEATWRVAHKTIGYLSVPLELLYLAAFFTVGAFKAVTMTIILLWLGLPSLISFLFWWKKCHGRL